MTWSGSSPLPAGEQPSRPLTGREQQILDLVGRGMTNRAIARDLSISHSTVKNHLRAIFAKLRVTDRTQVTVPRSAAERLAGVPRQSAAGASEETRHSGRDVAPPADGHAEAGEQEIRLDPELLEGEDLHHV
ncbi:helix-turn-helix domain-containing protein [Streptomyces shenzhenensis]|uniref:helix-turn-helix domain-containing protein n=1 Tax=Streptomyces shenzhenensis TaxID=943815 RepID=UPI0015F05A8E|nr:helix-turn-helix transcriptional regulator [Streptomyces shenzhenensis]